MTSVETSRVVERALDIVEYLAACAGPVRLADVARHTAFSKATAYRLLRTLCAGGLAARDGDDYVLGPQPARWTRQVNPAERVHNGLMPTLIELFDRTGGAVNVGVLHDGVVRYSVAVRDWNYPAGEPDRAAPEHSAVGKVLLAFAAATATDELRGIRERGAAIACDQWIRGQVEVAAPVFVGDSAIAAVRVAGIRGRLDLATATVQAIRAARKASASVVPAQRAGSA
ncbi:helix-turn-helix domain-containing protein [Kutzneria sp. CA-103260]|uniref:helix-turn-helix domain-containing protein n=1 Tax=Kutzneria sp. CA-103260 TaxID=2802641 RepID=UPI001BA4BD82|nr:helix-turn-helix domain-containing protein [Kutzneria sp. CA-103260]QUQ72324.1 transcriptional regulator [Kutzneria sp. CA-103260]